MGTATVSEKAGRQMSDDPIFRSGHEAIRFAYCFCPEQYPMTVMGKLMQRIGIGSGRGLHGLDGAATAGSVKRIIETLPSAYRNAIVARYAQTEEDFSTAILALVQPAVASLPTGAHKTRMILQLIGRNFGRDVKLADLCDTYGMDAATMTRRWQRVRECLRAIESEAATAADDALVDAGIVGRE